jgi:hypothetical protein
MKFHGWLLCLPFTILFIPFQMRGKILLISLFDVSGTVRTSICNSVQVFPHIVTEKYWVNSQHRFRRPSVSFLPSFAALHF